VYLVACDVHHIIAMMTCAWNDDFVHAILGKVTLRVLCSPLI
jgi:hypothetical protein